MLGWSQSAVGTALWYYDLSIYKYFVLYLIIIWKIFSPFSQQIRSLWNVIKRSKNCNNSEPTGDSSFFIARDLALWLLLFPKMSFTYWGNLLTIINPANRDYTSEYMWSCWSLRKQMTLSPFPKAILSDHFPKVMSDMNNNGQQTVLTITAYNGSFSILPHSLQWWIATKCKIWVTATLSFSDVTTRTTGC